MPSTAATTFLGIAFRRGDTRCVHDRLVMDATGGPFVHSELFLQDGASARFYTIIDRPKASAFCPAEGRRLPLPSDWETARFPVSRDGYKAAYALMLQLLTIAIPYNSRDLWQCCLKFLLPFERDLDCNDVSSWVYGGVFCSQACMLVLRRLATQGHITLPPPLLAQVVATNSRGCSPNTLHRMICRGR